MSKRGAQTYLGCHLENHQAHQYQHLRSVHQLFAFLTMNITGGLVTMSSLWRRSHIGHLYLQPMVSTSDQYWSVQIVTLSPQATFGLFMHLSFDWSVLNGKLFWSNVSAKIRSTKFAIIENSLPAFLSSKGIFKEKIIPRPLVRVLCYLIGLRGKEHSWTIHTKSDFEWTVITLANIPKNTMALKMNDRSVISVQQ